MRACTVAVTPAASRENPTAPFCVRSDNSTSLPGDTQHLNIEFLCLPIHLEGSEGAGRGWTNAEGVQCSLPSSPHLEWRNMFVYLQNVVHLRYTYCMSLLGPAMIAGLATVPIDMPLTSLLFTASSRDFFTSKAGLGQSQGCKAKSFPMLFTKPHQ